MLIYLFFPAFAQDLYYLTLSGSSPLDAGVQQMDRNLRHDQGVTDHRWRCSGRRVAVQRHLVLFRDRFNFIDKATLSSCPKNVGIPL